MCRICENFTQLNAAQFAYDMSAAQLFTAGSQEAADRDDELAAAIDAELHVCDAAGKPDEEILWAES
ncbi:MAG TPA: hypothetical protein VH256_09840 [Thermoleophilaceae bacterium]|jgi:hypothetical protein|nr:hypothetical protein [Thermoleophilaceae bacterium]